MESSSKRRRVGGGDDPWCRPSKPRPAEADREVNDDEVEEFFAIIRRMRDVKSSFAAARAGGARIGALPEPPAVAGSRWSPAFALEDFVGPDAMVARDICAASPAAAAEPTAAPRRLDLNTEPEPEDLAVVAPRLMVPQ